ncbi:MAG: 2-amino-4-hydroxy-6-hydroxymethyldihydropteridine diphosphokinase [Deltaproteobacteria bacterium]|nr:2-amino-4-hydroxy-6-hydroxymethyldihydropteridine diphosphokinase [Deltaproteobacteria bacterium]
MSEKEVFVGLGSNLGDSARTLLNAWNHLGKQRGVTLSALSPPFLSSPVDMASNHWFTNAVGQVDTTHSPDQFLNILLDTENHFGRVRNDDQHGFSDRTIDLDLLYFGVVILDNPRLTLPHPRRGDRLFVLAPLATIAPDFVDPENRRTITELHHHLLHTLASNQSSKQEINQRSWPEDIFKESA